MPLSDDVLRSAYRSSQRVAAGSCPPSEDLWDVATGAARSGRRDAVAAHVETCSSCAEDLKLILASGLTVEASALRPSWVRKLGELLGLGAGLPRTAAVAASAFLAIAITVIATAPRDGVPGATLRGRRSSPAPVDELPEAPRRLASPPSEGADGYQLLLLDEASSAIWESPESPEPSFDVPEDVRAKLEPRQRYHWRIVVIRGIDRSLGDLRSFVIEPR